MRPIVLAVAVSALAAGCLGGGESGVPRDPTSSPGAPPAATPTGGAPAANATAPALPGEPVTVKIYLTADHGLSFELPATGVALDANGIVDPESASGFSLVAWPMPSPNDVSYQITAASIEAWISSETPQQSLGAVAGGDAFAWIGEPGRNEAYLPLDGPDHLQPGEVARLAGELPLPAGGVVLPADATFAMLLGIVYTQTDAAPVRIHVGGEQASALTLTYRSLPAAATKPPATREETVTLGPEATIVEIPVSVNASTWMVEAVADGSATSGADVDVALLTPGGDVASSSTSPHGVETVRAMRPNFEAGGAGEYVLRVALAASSLGGHQGAPVTVRITTIEIA